MRYIHGNQKVDCYDLVRRLAFESFAGGILGEVGRLSLVGRAEAYCGWDRENRFGWDGIGRRRF